MAELRPDRVIALREERGLSQAALAREIGAGQSTMVRLEKGGTRNPRQVLALAAALRCSPAYLLGESDDRGDANAATEIRQPYRPDRRDIDPDLVEIDQIDLRYGLGATYVDVPVEAQRRVFSRSWLRQFTHSTPEHLFWTAGDGDSMEPTIRSGEIVLIDAAQKTPRMSGGIWAVAMGEVGMIKRLHIPARNRLQLLSDNGREPPIEPVPDDELQIIGRVVAVVRRL